MFRRWTGVLAAVTVTALVSAAPALAAQGSTVTATGTGQTRVTPTDRNSNASILAAVDAARKASISTAISQAHEYAQQYAAAVGLTLGGVLSISDASNGGGYYGPGPFFGPFGPNQYCGTVRRPIFTHVKGHRRHLTGFKKVHRCFVPPFAFVTLTVTYQAS
jgi:uncharacterized protein YggE